MKGQKAHSFREDGKALFLVTQTDHYFSKSYEPRQVVEEHCETTKEPEVVYFADGSGYRNCGGPCGPLYFDKFGNT